MRHAVLALVTVLSLLAANVARPLHLVLEAHRTCAEHGELVHGKARPAAAPEAPGAPGEDQHDHCWIALGGRVRAPEPPVVVTSCEDPAAMASELALEAPAPRAPAVPLFRLAPTLSPPA
jgi:hypothetical protein